MEEELTWGQIYSDFCNWNPDYARRVIDYRPWGRSSIVVWLDNGCAYKCKCHAADWFTVQAVSNDDIRRKYGLL